MRDFFYLLKAALQKWRDDNATRLSAALSYYGIFSLAPLLLIVIAAAGAFIGRDAVQGRIIDQFSGLLGVDGAKAIEIMIAGAYRSDSGLTATMIGIGVLLFGATGLFVELQDALDVVWGVAPNPKGNFFRFFKERWVSFLMILVIGFLLLMSLVFSALLSFLTEYSSELLPLPGFFIQFINFVFSIVMTALLFGAIFKFLPSIHIAWREVWAGALVSAVLFSVGKYLLGMYLGRAAITSGYGAAGSLIIILLWSNYSCQILLFGAEFAQVRASLNGKIIRFKSAKWHNNKY